MESSTTTVRLDRLIQRDLHARACAMPTSFQVIPSGAIDPSNVPQSEEAEKAAISQLKERFMAVRPTPESAAKALELLRVAKNGY